MTSKTETIVEGLSLEDLSMTLEIASRDDRGVPDRIRVSYKNMSPRRACVELPGPIRGGLNAAYRTPALTIMVQPDKDFEAMNSGGVFLYAPAETTQSDRPFYGVLEPGETATKEYPLASACMIGHGISAEPEAHFLACYGPGKIKNTMRALYISDFNKLTKRESNSVTVELSSPDFSMHSDIP